MYIFPFLSKSNRFQKHLIFLSSFAVLGRSYLSSFWMWIKNDFFFSSFVSRTHTCFTTYSRTSGEVYFLYSFWPYKQSLPHIKNNKDWVHSNGYPTPQFLSFYDRVNFKLINECHQALQVQMAVIFNCSDNSRIGSQQFFVFFFLSFLRL